MKATLSLRKQFEKETGMGTEIPDFKGEPRTFTVAYVKWLENKIKTKSLQSDSETITVKALRKRGTDRWYYWEPNGSYWEDTNVDIGASIRTIGFMNYKASVGLPADAELVTLECRIIKTIEP